MGRISHLMQSNVGRARGKRLFIVSSCLVDDFPDLIEKLITERDFVVKVCPEEIHINMIGYKIASFIAYSDIKEVAVLSTEGSLHCIQLHYIVEDVRNHFIPFDVKHLVCHKGEIYEISPKTIKTSRHLAKLEKLLNKKEK